MKPGKYQEQWLRHLDDMPNVRMLMPTGLFISNDGLVALKRMRREENKTWAEVSAIIRSNPENFFTKPI